MKYSCYDTFMIRTPSLPINISEELLKKDMDIIDYIQEKGLKSFLDEALFYVNHNLINKISHKSSYDFKSTLYKYMIRSSSRPTPYGLFAAVGLGFFDEKTSIIRHKKIDKYIQIDNTYIK